MDETLNGAEQVLIAAASAFARDTIAPDAPGWEHRRVMPEDRIRRAAEAGLTGLLVSREHGGHAVSMTAMARVMEELSKADMGYAFVLVVHNNLMGAISRAGSAAQVERYLGPMKTGETLGAFLLTEPAGGSDAAAITTRAERDGDGWVLNGAKAWITSAAQADLLSVYAQTDPSLGWRGIATFLVDADTPGIVRETPYETLGAHVMGTGGFRFEDCRIGAATMLMAPGDGFKAAMAGIDIARANVAAMCCGMMRSSLDTALAYVCGRKAFGQRLGDFQGLQWQLADVATDLHASRLMAYDAAAAIDAGQSAVEAAAHAKKFATRAALAGIAQCMQAMGADGFSHDYPLARHLACAKMAQYIDGTTEIQNVVLSRALLKPYE